MCRRSGHRGLAEGEAGAVGTIGLLGMPDARPSDAAARSAVARVGRSSLVVALVTWPLIIWPLITPVSSLADASSRLSNKARRQKQPPRAAANNSVRGTMTRGTRRANRDMGVRSVMADSRQRRWSPSLLHSTQIHVAVFVIDPANCQATLKLTPLATLILTPLLGAG